MIPVQSSRVSYTGWQPDSPGADTGSLWVVFTDKDGTSGFYAGVPLQTFELFRDSDSKGRFINSQLKGQYEFVKAPLPELSSQ